VNPLATIRLELAAALEPVLPGRVHPFPPTTRRWSTPLVFVDDVALTRDPAAGWVASFPVWLAVDGTVESAVAVLDDLKWNTVAALRPLCVSVNVTPQTVAGLRAAVVDAAVTVDVESLCAPDPPTAVQIPPAPATLAG
jgi:hypothetical protein